MKLTVLNVENDMSEEQVQNYNELPSQNVLTVRMLLNLPISSLIIRSR